MVRRHGPQSEAADPTLCAFVEAHAGSGKTTTLVNRVARLLLAGAAPEAILCVTYTKAAAAEMQARLFNQLGGWAVMDDAALKGALADIDEANADLSRARALFARALETPGGLKIQTLHGFCERLLRRFPLEAGVRPGFAVLDDQAADEVSRAARDALALQAQADPDGPLGRAYRALSVELAHTEFDDMQTRFEADRIAISRYVESCGGDVAGDVWRRMGLAGAPRTAEDIAAEARGPIPWRRWRAAVQVLAASPSSTDQKLAAAMAACDETSSLADLAAPFMTLKRTLRKDICTQKIDAETKHWLSEQGARLHAAFGAAHLAAAAALTVDRLRLASTYAAFYAEEKRRLGALDFADLVALAGRLLRDASETAWVLYKLDGGVSHLLLDEAQDTSPEQWDILRALSGELFAGRGAVEADRSIFAVGDEKQSIFSFQGAAPERLGEESRRFEALARAAQRPFRKPLLAESWRSTPQILEAVDAVFRSGPALVGVRPGVGAAPGSDESVIPYPITHRAGRATPGRVDLWPLEPDIKTPASDDLWESGGAEPVQSRDRRHADRIAREIAAMRDQKLGVWERIRTDDGRREERLRPCRAGDFLVLVRRRGALFHEIIRALKRAGVPVGGPDRLNLALHGLHQDLTALGRFALFPEDDLTLAGLLRSPFCDLDEESLFLLAHARRGSLIAALRRRRGEREDWARAADLLDWAHETLRQSPPFDGFSRVLARLDASGVTYRQRLLTRLGGEGEEALNAVLAQILAAEASGDADLERVVARLSRLEREIKREADPAERSGEGEVRVMTTHAAKGLEAPIVILPDTTTLATDQKEGSWLSLVGGGYAWVRPSPFDTPHITEARNARRQRAADESIRLLYVALTRARDWLIVAGVENPRPSAFKSSWRDLVEQGFARLDDLVPARSPGGAEIMRLGPAPATVTPEAPASALAAVVPPPWTRSLARPESGEIQASPSGFASQAAEPALSPLAGAGSLGPYRRGELIHGLLERLPDLPPAERAAAARAWLAREGDLPGAVREEIAAAALGVLEDSRFAPVFGPGSRAEVAVAGGARSLPDGLRLSGRIDRLVVTPERVLIVDFKTNRPAPDRAEDAPEAYLAQMAAYAAILGEIYPDRNVEAALVWTDGPRLMPLSADLLRAGRERIAGTLNG